MSVGFPVFTLFLVFQHAEVGGVARLADAVLLHGFQHGAARFVPVRAVAVAAIGRSFKYLREVMSDFFPLHVEGAEALDARCVDEVAAGVVHGIHLGEGGGVHALVVSLRDFPRPCLRAGQDGVDEGGFSHARVAGEERDASAKLCLHLVEPLALRRRNFEAGIADGGVEVYQAVQVTPVILVVQVRFVEEEQDGDAVGFGCSQETVDEGGGCFRMVHGDHQHALVQVGRDDVRLLREVGGAPDDVVFPVLDFGDEGCPFPVFDDAYTVAHGHGVGAADAFQAEVAFHLALHVAPVVRADDVPAAGILDYEACHKFLE